MTRTPTTLTRHPDGEFEVVTEAPPGATAIRISTGSDRPDPRSEPSFGLNGRPVARGWGEADVLVPPGQYFLSVQRNGRPEAIRSVSVTDGETIELHYRAVRGRTARAADHGQLGPPGVKRLPPSFAPYALPFFIVVNAALTFIVVPTSLPATSEATVFQLLGLNVLIALTLCVAVGFAWRGHRLRIRRRQADVPRAVVDGTATLVPDVPGLRNPLGGTGAFLRVIATNGILATDSDDWMPAPTVMVDNRRLAVESGLWWVELPPGDHTIHVETQPVRPDAPVARQDRTITVEGFRPARWNIRVWENTDPPGQRAPSLSIDRVRT